ncbi:sensor histidine kinase [Pelagibacterium limicola]|uniref:sensor histidine kinase n=1 Tax=Pelagibacterium limicola TaxID=2791022 RepID=UPI0018AFB0F6|nr:sensor histidine kinase [Pelagibacterium limicola]
MSAPTAETIAPPDKDGAATRTAPHRRSYPVLVYLIVLVGMIVVPILGFTAVLLQRHNVAQEEVVETFTVATTRSVVQAVEREISGMFSTLRVLGRAQSLLEGDLERFHAHAQSALSGTGSFLIVIDANLNQLLNTRVPFGTSLGKIADPESGNRVFSTTDAIVSNLFWGTVAEQFVFNVLMRRQPPHDNQAIILTQNAAGLSSALLTRELPDGWHVALVDGNNRVIAASQDSAETGDTLFLPLLESSGTSMRWREREIGGESYRTITQRSILTGWYVVAWAPVWVVQQPLRSALLWLLAGGAALIGIAAIGVFILARRIARSVHGLAREAKRLGTGADIEPTHYPVHELSQVSQALADAARKRKAAETEVRFLLRELAHRSKNQLTVISAMAKQTAQGAETVAQFVEGFQHRIYGLARSTDLLLAHGTQGIGLRDLIRTQIDPFRPEDPARVTKTGPNILLNIQSAQVLGMAAHELSTNASKYGAFSVPDGRLVVNWNRAGGGRLHVSWREHVPGFTPPQERKGFGTVVLKTMVSGALKADVERILHEDGIEWVFSIPLAEIDPDRQPVGIDGTPGDSED